MGDRQRSRQGGSGAVFTGYLRSLDPNGEPPGEEEFDAVWQALRSAVYAELRRRGLWHVSPGRLGILGWERWTDPGGRQRDDALDELVEDAYTLIFLDRIESLRAHLRVKPNVDGLVFLNLRHFISERQRRQDPLGARIWNVSRSAVREAVGERDLFIVAGEPTVYNETVLAFRADTLPSGAVSRTELRPHVERWCDELLPELITTRGRGQRHLLAEVRSHVLRLEELDVAAFIFRDLVDLLKGDARRRWKAVFEQARGETALEPGADDEHVVVPLVRPDAGVESRQSFYRLVDCTGRELRALPVDARTARELKAVWELLLAWAAESGHTEPELRLDDESAPSRRQVGRLLDIPRDRLPGLYKTLGDVLEKCRATVAHPGYPEAEAAAPRPVGAMMSTEERRTRLRRATGEAMARAARAEESARAAPEDPRPGDVYTLPASAPWAVEWVVLGPDPLDASRLRAVAADTLPPMADADVAVPAEARGGPLVLRSAHVLTLPRGVFDAAYRSRSLDPSYVELTLGRRERLEAGAAETDDDGADGLELDPEVRDWRAELSRAADAVAATSAGGTGDERSPPLAFSPPRREGGPRRARSPRRGGRLWLEVLAAVLAVVCLGLVTLAVEQRRRIRRQDEPFFNPPPQEILLQDEVRDFPVEWTVPGDARLQVLVLAFVRPPLCEAFRLEIRSAGGGVLWASPELDISPGTSLELALPRRFLERRPASLRFFGRCGGDRWTLLENRALDIEFQ